MFMFYTTKYMHFKALSLKSKYSILLYSMSKKSWPNLYGNLLYKIGQNFLDILYSLCSALKNTTKKYYWAYQDVTSEII